MKPLSQFVIVMASACLAVAPVVADEFHVAAFGARGDGVTDDGPAIREAVAAAVEAAPGAKVVFEKKNLHLRQTGG